MSHQLEIALFDTRLFQSEVYISIHKMYNNKW